VQHIDIPEFDIRQRLSRPTYLLNSPESPVIYISKTSVSGVMSLNYISEPLATYFGVTSAGDIRVILSTPDEHIAELFTAVFQIPELPQSWKDSAATPSPSFTELASMLVPSGRQDYSPPNAPASYSSPKAHATVIKHGISNHPAISEISNAEALSVMEVINRFFTHNPLTPDLGTSDERPKVPRTLSRGGSKKSKSRGTKFVVSHGRHVPLQLSLPCEVARSHGLDPANWRPHQRPSISPVVPRHRFQDFEAVEEHPNIVTGFAGEYFVISSASEALTY
jgi:hypothetical protein